MNRLYHNLTDNILTVGEQIIKDNIAKSLHNVSSIGINGGNITWFANTQSLYWDEPIYIINNNIKYKITIPNNTNNITYINGTNTMLKYNVKNGIIIPTNNALY